jgi:hypothetical protein
MSFRRAGIHLDLGVGFLLAEARAARAATSGRI